MQIQILFSLCVFLSFQWGIVRENPWSKSWDAVWSITFKIKHRLRNSYLLNYGSFRIPSSSFFDFFRFLLEQATIPSGLRSLHTFLPSKGSKMTFILDLNFGIIEKIFVKKGYYTYPFSTKRKEIRRRTNSVFACLLSSCSGSFLNAIRKTRHFYFLTLCLAILGSRAVLYNFNASLKVSLLHSFSLFSTLYHLKLLVSMKMGRCSCPERLHILSRTLQYWI